MHIQRAAKQLGRLHSLEFLFLDVATVIIIQDAKDLLHFLGALVGEATSLEELLGAEGVRCCKEGAKSRVRNARSPVGKVEVCYFFKISFCSCRCSV